LAAAATGMLVGAATVATRGVIGETNPIALALLRYMIGVLCLAPFLIRVGRVRFAAGDILPMAGLGIMQFGILIVLLNFGLQYIPAGRAALVFASFPLLTLLFARLLGRETLTLSKTLGVLLTICGVGLALGEKILGGAAAGGWTGEAAVLASAVCGALCSVLYQPYLQRYPTLSVGAFAMLASVVFLAGLAAPSGFFAEFPRFSARGWTAVLLIGISSGIGYLTWLWALANTTPTKVTVFQALAPVTATVLGWLMLGEPISTTFLAGLVAVAGGLCIAHFPQREASLMG
jgi:drug/metabolite transporter (DMT)-like permease